MTNRVISRDIWNGWTRNYIHADDGYITHAFDEQWCRLHRDFRSLCGVKLQDSGLLKLGQNMEFGATESRMYWIPGCKKCRAILQKAELIEKKNEKGACA